jgi:catechol 2,3-dioxygenase
MNISRFGRASLQVRDLEASARFYSEVLGLPVVAHEESANAIELSVGRSHRFALQCVRHGGGTPAEHLGLNGLAFVVGNTPGNLDQAAEHLNAAGIVYERVAHDEYESLLLRDPDGHLVELYYWPEW